MKVHPRGHYALNFRHYVHKSGTLTNGLVAALVGRTWPTQGLICLEKSDGNVSSIW